MDQEIIAHDTSGPTAAVTSVAFATLEWLHVLDVIVSILAGLVAITSGVYAIRHYRRLRRESGKA